MPPKGKAGRIAESNNTTKRSTKPRQPRKKEEIIQLNEAIKKSIEKDIEEMEQHFKEEVPIESPKAKEMKSESTIELKQVVKEVNEEVKEEQKPEVKEDKSEMKEEVKPEQKPEVKEEVKENSKIRKLKNKNSFVDEKGVKIYEYVYEILDENGNVISTQTVSNNKKLSSLKKYSPEMDNELGEAMKQWLDDNKINKGLLYKRVQLDQHIKDIAEYIIAHKEVKLTQKQIREIFKAKVLEMQ